MTTENSVQPPPSLRGGPLTSADIARLEKGGIPRELAEQAFLRRVDTEEGAAIVGRKGPANCAGIVFPYMRPGVHSVVDYRLRRDEPDLVQKKGVTKEQGKYLSPPGRGNMLYLVPGTDPAWLKDIDLPILITEGEKKALALWALASHGLGEAAERPRWLPVGLSGVWNWRGTVGKAAGPDGGRRDVKGAIADLDHIAWKGRLVKIVFDTNAALEESVNAARKMLAKELKERGATVTVINLPDVAGVNGIDDLVGVWGSEKVLDLLNEPGEAPDPKKASVADIADHLTKKGVRFACGAGKALYVYRGGVYLPDGEAAVQREVKAWCKETNQVWVSGELGDRVADYIAIDAPELLERPPLDTINVQNGLLDVATRTLRPHSPDFLSPVQLPVEYHENAQCPAIEQFCSQVLPADSQYILWLLAAWLMLPSTDIQKAVLLLGVGANGKSALLNILTDFLGKDNVSTSTLHTLESRNFATSALVGKLANVCPDLPTKTLSDTSVFKRLTGGDMLDAERKFGATFSFRPYSRLIFSANIAPRSDDATHGFFRRWLVVPFNRRTFSETDPDTVPTAILRERLGSPSELSGLLNHALDSIAQIQKGFIPESESMREAWAEFRASTDPLTMWLDETVIEDPEGLIPKQEVLARYNHYRRDAGKAVTDTGSLTQALLQWRQGVRTAQRTVNDIPRVWCYVGVGWQAAKGEQQTRSEDRQTRFDTVGFVYFGDGAFRRTDSEMSAAIKRLIGR